MPPPLPGGPYRPWTLSTNLFSFVGLDGLRSVVAANFHPHMVALSEEIRRSSRLLRELADCSRLHPFQVAIVVNHLNVILPCLSRTLRDIISRFEDKTVSRENRWRKMYHEMLKEAGDLPLPQRFMMYNRFLTLLLFLLVRDKNYDRCELEFVRARILELRQRRGIPPPVQMPIATGHHQPVRPPPPTRNYPYEPLPMRLPQPVPSPRARRPARQEMRLVPMSMPTGAVARQTRSSRQSTLHWAEYVCWLPLVSRTPMEMTALATGAGGQAVPAGESKAYGPLVPSWDEKRPETQRMLIRWSFNEGQLHVLFVMSAKESAPFVVVRNWTGGTQWYSYRGHHEICLRRAGNKLVLKRWSLSADRPKRWVVLSFVTWEGE